jgi:hypothetical protein
VGGEEQRERHLFDAEERTSATPRVKKRLDLPASELKRYPKIMQTTTPKLPAAAPS